MVPPFLFISFPSQSDQGALAGEIAPGAARTTLPDITLLLKKGKGNESMDPFPSEVTRAPRARPNTPQPPTAIFFIAVM